MPAARSPRARPLRCSAIRKSSAPIWEMPMLEVAGVSASYGKHRALDGVSLSVARGEIVVMLGANGAGKTTLLNVLAGLVPAAPGARIAMGARDLTSLPPHAIVE